METNSSMTDSEFNDVFLHHKDVLYRFAYRMTGSSSIAEDVVQDCFLVLWNKPRAYDSNLGTMRAFLIGIARNLILKRWRRERPHEPLDEEFFVCESIDLVTLERVEAVSTAVRMLPALQRESLILAEYEEMSLHEICVATESELAAVKSRLHRARQNLRHMLAPWLEGRSHVCRTRG
jgi:RNA polymerase sigma-70 factor (ECF subfamily)